MAMEVILKQDVDHLGLRGEVVNVARGYARNFLLPRGLAEVATPALVKEIEKRDAQRARHEAKSVDEARAIATRLEALELRFDVNAGPTGALFGSVTATNVADRLWEKEKIRVDRRKLEMDTIKRIGRYRVSFEVFTDVVAELKVVVAPEGHELPPKRRLPPRSLLRRSLPPRSSPWPKRNPRPSSPPQRSPLRRSLLQRPSPWPKRNPRPSSLPPSPRPPTRPQAKSLPERTSSTGSPPACG